MFFIGTIDQIKRSYLVFIVIFNFLGAKPNSTHALFHYCQPLPDLLGHVIHFCKYPCAILIQTYVKSLQKNSSIIAY